MASLAVGAVSGKLNETQTSPEQCPETSSLVNWPARYGIASAVAKITGHPYLITLFEWQ